MSPDLKPDETGAGLHVQVGILGERVSGIEKNLGGQIGGLSQQLTAALVEIRASYATTSALETVKGDVAVLRGEMAGVGKKVDGITASVGWGVKIVLAVVMTSLIGLLFAKGALPHP